jgi:Undecaprenyl-phosphate galactose phosphotransferase WbaP
MEVLDVRLVRSVKRVGAKRAVMYQRRRFENAMVIAGMESLGIISALMLAGSIRALIFGSALIPLWSWILIPTWCFGGYVLRILPGWGMASVEQLRRLTLLLGFTFGAVAILMFVGGFADETSRMTLMLAFIFSLLLVPIGRTMAKGMLIRAGVWGVDTAVYGAGELGRRVIQGLREEPGIGYRPMVVYDDNEDLWGERIEGVPVAGPLDQRGHGAPVAIVALQDTPPEQIVGLLEGPLTFYRRIVIAPDLLGSPSLWVRSRDIGGTLGLEITCNLFDPLSRGIKRSVDFILTTLTVPVWGTICGILAGLIWLEDRQSPLFRQKRVAMYGEEFETLKFRTMVPDAEGVLQRALDKDPELREEWEMHYKLKNDPRITKVGRFLRKTSLDELPQLINVLRGEMSLVGPRPLPRYHHGELPDQVRHLRDRVRPGMTGLWQVSGRSDSGNEGFVRWDSYYVRNWSPWLDAVILFRTFRVVLKREGAY